MSISIDTKRRIHYILNMPLLNVWLRASGWLIAGIGWLQRWLVYWYGYGIGYAYTRRPIRRTEMALLLNHYSALSDPIRLVTLGLLCEAGREDDARALHEGPNRPKPAEAAGCVVYHYLKNPPDDWAKALYELRNWTECLDYMKGKSVVIVGNSPCEHGRGLGETIDAFDVVVRFNNFHRNFAAYAADYGRRTHIWVHSASSAVNFSAEALDAAAYVLFCGELRYRAKPYHLPQVLDIFKRSPEKTVLLPLSALRRSLSPLPPAPSIGLQVIELFTQFGIDFRFCGFRPEEQGRDFALHFNSGRQPANVLHDWPREARYLRRYQHLRL